MRFFENLHTYRNEMHSVEIAARAIDLAVSLAIKKIGFKRRSAIISKNGSLKLLIKHGKYDELSGVISIDHGCKEFTVGVSDIGYLGTDRFTYPPQTFSSLDGVIEYLEGFLATDIDTDAVNNPSHYNQSSIETIDAIESIVTGYAGIQSVCAGNVVKYIARAPFKGKILEDLEKARWYLNRLIQHYENETE